MVHLWQLPRVWPPLGAAALTRGDGVAATARDTDTLAELIDAHGDQAERLKTWEEWEEVSVQAQGSSTA